MIVLSGLTETRSPALAEAGLIPCRSLYYPADSEPGENPAESGFFPLKRQFGFKSIYYPADAGPGDNAAESGLFPLKGQYGLKSIYYPADAGPGDNSAESGLLPLHPRELHGRLWQLYPPVGKQPEIKNKNLCILKLPLYRFNGCPPPSLSPNKIRVSSRYCIT
jgi:hypothetical protein